MFTPEADLARIWQIVKDDAEVKTALGLVGATPVQIASRIIKRSRWDDLAQGEKRLCLYFRPSRLGRNAAVTEMVLQADCHVPAAEDYLAWRVQRRLQLLLHGLWLPAQNITVGGTVVPGAARRLMWDGTLGELPTMPGFFCAGSRFVFHCFLRS